MNNITNLISKGRMEVPLVSSDIIEEIQELILKLVQMPHSERKKWLFDNHGDDADTPDSGLIEKRKDEGKDEKFMLHWRPSLMQQLAGRGVDIKKHFRLLQLLQILYERCRASTEQIVFAMDEAMPEYDLLNRHFMVPENVRCTLRWLVYMEGYRIMAQAHPDKDFLTHQIWNSRNGLYFFDEQKLYESVPDQAMAFTGLKAKIRTDGLLKMNEHYVLNEVLTETRMSCVFFSHIYVGVPEKDIRKMVEDRIAELTPQVQAMAGI
jgi:hypothetical protein